MDQSAVQRGLKLATQAAQLERVSQRELSLDSTILGLLPGGRECGLSQVNAQNLQPQRGDTAGSVRRAATI